MSRLCGPKNARCAAGGSLPPPLKRWRTPPRARPRQLRTSMCWAPSCPAAGCPGCPIATAHTFLSTQPSHRLRAAIPKRTSRRWWRCVRIAAWRQVSRQGRTARPTPPCRLQAETRKQRNVNSATTRVGAKEKKLRVTYESTRSAEVRPRTADAGLAPTRALMERNAGDGAR